MIPSVFESLLLFALSIPIVMKYRILPIDGTPYWLFGVLFIVLLTQCIISFYPEILGLYRKYINIITLFFLCLTISIVLGGTMITAIMDRAKTATVYGVHDIILQQEAAMRYLIEGKNPYKETYFGTPVELFNYDEPGSARAINPALYHFVMPPWYLLFPFVFYSLSIPMLGFFDGRMALLFTMIMLLCILWYWFKDKGIARIAIVFTALSPSVVEYFVEGRSDVFALSWLMGAIVLLHRKHFIWSGVMLALACLSKQTIWFIVPFYFIYLWKNTSHKRKQFWFTVISSALIEILFIAPFFVWDSKAFLDSVVFYLTGNTAMSYPVSGYGFGMMLYEFGFIKDIHAYYPFIIWQLIIVLPVFIILIRWLWNRPTEPKLIISYAVFLMVYWYMSRYFNNSHLGYLSMLFVLGGLKVIDERIQTT